MSLKKLHGIIEAVKHHGRNKDIIHCVGVQDGVELPQSDSSL